MIESMYRTTFIMSTENPRRETRKDNHPYEIKLDIPFKPFERARRFYYPQKGEQPFLIPEKHTHALLLRREVLFYSIKRLHRYCK